jgi:ribosome-binding factor A
MAVKRASRVGEEVREVLASLIGEVKDPEVGFVTITDVAVSDDLRQAKVYVSVYGDAAKVKKSLAALQRVSSFLRRELGHRAHLRFTPELKFFQDEAIVQGARIEALLRGNEHADTGAVAPVDTGREVASIGEKIAGPLPPLPVRDKRGRPKNARGKLTRRR